MHIFKNFHAGSHFSSYNSTYLSHSQTRICITKPIQLLKLFIIGKMGSFLFSLQGFITDHERALEDLYGEDGEKSRKSEACLNEMGSRIATVFASLKVYLIN